MGGLINYEAFERQKAELLRALKAKEISSWEYDEGVAEIDNEINDLHREECGYDGFTRGLV